MSEAPVSIGTAAPVSVMERSDSPAVTQGPVTPMTMERAESLRMDGLVTHQDTNGQAAIGIDSMPAIYNDDKKTTVTTKTGGTGQVSNGTVEKVVRIQQGGQGAGNSQDHKTIQRTSEAQRRIDADRKRMGGG